MKYYDINISYQEVPDEISLTFYIPGCSLSCPGCHSPFLHDETKGHDLTLDHFMSVLKQYKGLASCVLFMGGEWFKDLPEYLKMASEMGYSTCLYTGLKQVNSCLSEHLTYLKTGPWIQSLGGLDNPNTNQVFTDLITGECLNYKFNKETTTNVHKTDRKTT